jgi:hypothetical protein
MNITLSKFASAGLFFVFIFLSGYWLNRTKKPYSALLVTVHKLIGLAAGIFLGLAVYRTHLETPLTTVQFVSVVVTVIFFAVNVATGSLLSTNKPMPAAVSLINKWFPYLTVVATGTMLYLLGMFHLS